MAVVADVSSSKIGFRCSVRLHAIINLLCIFKHMIIGEIELRIMHGKIDIMIPKRTGDQKKNGVVWNLVSEEMHR